MHQQQMKWGALVDKLLVNHSNLHRREIGSEEYRDTFASLMKELAEEIRSNPYGEAKPKKPWWRFK